MRRFFGPRRLVPAPLRCHLRLNGEPKTKYGEEAAKRQAKRHGKDAYQCPVCNFWHVGGSKGAP